MNNEKDSLDARVVTTHVGSLREQLAHTYMHAYTAKRSVLGGQ